MTDILVVEDNDEVAAYLQDMLEVGDYRVERAATAYGAVIRAGRTKFDLVLMDLSLGGPSGPMDLDVDGGYTSGRQGDVNGAVTTLALRGMGGYADVPIIVITGGLTVLDPAVEAACRFAGKLLKPALPRDVMPEIEKHLGKRDG